MLERYADVADLSSDDLRQMKVIFKSLDDTRFKNVKDQPSLPSVVSFDYVKNYTPLGPIEPGMRLLKSVTVSTKVGQFLVYFLICLVIRTRLSSRLVRGATINIDLIAMWLTV